MDCRVEPCSTGFRTDRTEHQSSMARLYRNPWPRLFAASGGDDVVLVHVHAQAIVADVLGGDGVGADRVDQAGTAFTGQAADVGFIGRLADCPAQLAGVAVAGTLDLRTGGADAGRQQQGRRGSNRDRRKADMQRSCAGKMGGTIAPSVRKASAPRSLPAQRDHCIVSGMTGSTPAGRPGHSGAGAGEVCRQAVSVTKAGQWYWRCPHGA